MPEPIRPPTSPFPLKTGLQVLWDALWVKPRSIRQDAVRCIDLLYPPPKYLFLNKIPQSEPCLFVLNHYSRPGFGAWWIGLGISAVVPEKIHWMMTAGWTHTGILNPLTRWLFPRLAQVYGFTATPPMPPSPPETLARAKAVRSVLWKARNTDVHIAIAPEGRDHPGGVLGDPPPGVGRFLIQLTKYRERIIPIGVYEDADEDYGLCFQFGPAFQLDIPKGLTSKDRDRLASQQVMESIARQLPPALRGD